MRRYRFRALLTAVFLALSAVSYSYATFSRWTTVPVTIFVNPANLDVSPAAAVTAIQWGMGQWTNAGSAFRFDYGGTVSDAATALDGRNLAFFRNGSNGSAIATTYAWTNNNGDLLDADIIFWDASFRFFTGTSGCSSGAYIEDIATHELGHVLGLNHTTTSDGTMYPSYSLCSQAFRTLSQDDLNGVRALYPATSNTAPTVAITSPTNGASFANGTIISFAATASDTQDGSLTAQIQWTDNGTFIGSGGRLSLPVSAAGSHVIEARVTDSAGAKGSARVSITVAAAATSANTAPTVAITRPASGSSFVQGTSISLVATASDTQDGNLTAQIRWTDNGAAAGSGGTVTRRLKTRGTHVLVATVTDSGGLQRSSQVTVTVTAKP